MSRGPTKAELAAECERLRAQSSAEGLALSYLGRGAKPDYDAKLSHPDGGRVRIRAYGLTRGDGGVVVTTAGSSACRVTMATGTLEYVRSARHAHRHIGGEWAGTLRDVAANIEGRQLALLKLENDR